MATGKTGGLNWHGVGRPSGSGQQTTRVDTLLNKTKASRQQEAMRAPKVGSASIVSSDDWLASAAANREARERDGAVGNPFVNAEALVKESNRQASSKARSEFDVEDGADEPDWLPPPGSMEGWRSPGFYAGGQDEPLPLLSHQTRSAERRDVQEDDVQEDAKTERPTASGVSRQRMRDIEISVRLLLSCVF
ncbi:MAG: hypothetical protein AAF368_03600 [Planctomycetota bacterium]